MEKALSLTGEEYAAALSVFFGLYCLLEVPSNLILKKIGAKKWIPIIVVAWGLVMLLTGTSKNFEALLAWRILLGAAEAVSEIGSGPGQLIKRRWELTYNYFSHHLFVS